MFIFYFQSVSQLKVRETGKSRALNFLFQTLRNVLKAVTDVKLTPPMTTIKGNTTAYVLVKNTVSILKVICIWVK